jgi:hypothetical protein
MIVCGVRRWTLESVSASFCCRLRRSGRAQARDVIHQKALQLFQSRNLISAQQEFLRLIYNPVFVTKSGTAISAGNAVGGLAKRKTRRSVQSTRPRGMARSAIAWGCIHQQMGDPESVRLNSADPESLELLLECSRHLATGETSEAMRVRLVTDV